MPQAPVYNQEGQQTGTMELRPDVFAVAARSAVLHQVIVAADANARHAIASTKTRGEVRGGGRKPWKQKGTGRARAGSIRSPIWVGGGTTFGPRAIRNFALKVNKKMRRAAVRMALSEKVAASRLLVLEGFSPADGKTKAAVRTLGALAIAAQTERKAPSMLMVLAASERAAARSIRNVPRVYGMDAAHLNARDVVKHDVVIATKEAIAVMMQQLSSSEPAS
ncbi:MAG: 50S ribosomal protein L4 [bacterium]|nr:50S ribosomal protein L4 [bacterium]